MRESEVNQAISLPRLSYGISSKALGFCWGPGALVTVMVGTSISWWYASIPLAMAAAAHSVLKYLFKQEPKIFDMYSRYTLMNNEYQPHSRSKLPTAFERPYKVGRGVRN